VGYTLKGVHLAVSHWTARKTRGWANRISGIFPDRLPTRYNNLPQSISELNRERPERDAEPSSVNLSNSWKMYSHLKYPPGLFGTPRMPFPPSTSPSTLLHPSLPLRLSSLEGAPLLHSSATPQSPVHTTGGSAKETHPDLDLLCTRVQCPWLMITLLYFEPLESIAGAPAGPEASNWPVCWSYVTP